MNLNKRFLVSLAIKSVHLKSIYMKNNRIHTAEFLKGKSKLYFFVCMILFATSTLTACNNNNNHGDATASHDTSSTVTDRVDTAATDSGTKQP